MSRHSAQTFVDTNVLVYLFDGTEAAKQNRARDVVDRLGRFVISAQVLGEFYVTVIRKLGTTFGQPVALEAVQQLARESVVGIDAMMVRSAIETSQRAQISYWNALIIEAAVAGRCDRILTEDLSAGQVIRGVEIVNPFA